MYFNFSPQGFTTSRQEAVIYIQSKNPVRTKQLQAGVEMSVAGGAGHARAKS